MIDEHDKSHDPSAQALGRWESEGGAPKGGRYLDRPRDADQPAAEDAEERVSKAHANSRLNASASASVRK